MKTRVEEHKQKIRDVEEMLSHDDISPKRRRDLRRHLYRLRQDLKEYYALHPHA